MTALMPNCVELEVFFWIDTFKQPQGLINIPTEVMDRCQKEILAAGFTVSPEVTTSIMIGGRAPVDVRVTERENDARG